VTHRYWPLAGLLLATDDVTLRPMTEGDLGSLADLVPDDVEQNPIFPSYAGRDGRAAHGTVLHQTYWHSLGTWRSESWTLPLTVSVDGSPVGVQTLEADDFAARRTVDSSSWLTTTARGRGIGKRMRRAILTLAFDGLGAMVAETSAWHDNEASLGVSRSLGYVDNGVYTHADPGRVDEMRRMRLIRAVWLQHRHTDVRIEGLPPCLPFFGVR
jgi:RimJ/RimL family protein N-acetyltransferase